jgi:5'-nucleotidase
LNILIANVRNIRANEIKVLAEALNKKHRVTIISHMQNSSNRGLAFSFHDRPVQVSPLLYKDIVKNSSWVWDKDAKTVGNISDKKLEAFDGIGAYEFGGDPADSVSITLCEIMAHKKPDLVICGINNGRHMGQDIYCSSNIGMAMEATFFGVPAIAVGVERKIGGNNEKDLSVAVEFIEKNVEKFAKLQLPKNTFLNISIPTVKKYKDLKGIKFARMGQLTQLHEFVEKIDANGNKYYWAKHVERKNALTNEILDENTTAPTWFERGYVTIVPLNYDSTDYDAIKEWNKSISDDMKRATAEVKS